MEAIEETVIVAVSISRAYAGWSEFQSLPIYPSGSVQAKDGHARTEDVWRHVDSATGAGNDQRIAWLSLDGTSHTGVAIFSPLDSGNTRVSVRFTWPPTAPAARVSGTQILTDLVQFKDFMESLPAVPST